MNLDSVWDAAFVHALDLERGDERISTRMQGSLGVFYLDLSDLALEDDICA